jgi:hypothetical protein
MKKLAVLPIIILFAHLAQAQNIQLNTAYQGTDANTMDSDDKPQLMYFIFLPTESNDIGYDSSFGPDPSVHFDQDVFLVICVNMLGGRPYIAAPELRIYCNRKLSVPTNYDYDTGLFTTLIKIYQNMYQAQSSFLDSDKTSAKIFPDYVTLYQRLETIDNTFIKVYWSATEHYVFRTAGAIAKLRVKMKEMGDPF